MAHHVHATAAVPQQFIQEEIDRLLLSPAPFLNLLFGFASNFYEKGVVSCAHVAIAHVVAESYQPIKLLPFLVRKLLQPLCSNIEPGPFLVVLVNKSGRISVQGASSY